MSVWKRFSTINSFASQFVSVAFGESLTEINSYRKRPEIDYSNSDDK